MLEQIWKEYSSYNYLQEDLQQIRTQRGRNLLYPEKMFTGFRVILEEATNQKWQLTQKIDELQLKEDYLFNEIAKIYGFNNYSELQLARNIPHLYQRIQM